jgi:hypothetical protein
VRIDADETETFAMMELDSLLARAVPPTPAGLDGLEDGVWRRVGRVETRRRERRLRAAALGLAALVGGLAGGVTTPRFEAPRGELSIFSPHMAATPLDIRGVLG